MQYKKIDALILQNENTRSGQVPMQVEQWLDVDRVKSGKRKNNACIRSVN